MILEIRPGEGGEDASAFAKQLFDALLSFASKQGQQIQDTDLTTRTYTAVVRPGNVLTRFVGTHRIQRIPKSDTRGRRHTSTVTVALLPETRSTPVVLSDADLSIEHYRGTGNGGQNRNKVATAVRIRHLPTGLVVSCEEERYQHANLVKAKKRLTDRLILDNKLTIDNREQLERQTQIASGERPVKEWTWNQQRNEVLDHSNGSRTSYQKALKGNLIF